jgi:hypothetical protein
MTGRGGWVADLRAGAVPRNGRHQLTALREVRPDAAAVTEATELLGIAPRRRQKPLVIQAHNPVDAAIMPSRSCLA